jgi:arsenate reductase
LETLLEIGIQDEGWSKQVAKFRDVDFDLVVTVCDSAAEKCPVWLGRGKRSHHSFPDPAISQGTDEEVMNVFRAVRDTIQRDTIKMLQTYED